MDKKEQFIQAIQSNEALIYKIAAVYTDNAEDRKDLVQEIIYNCWKSFGSFNQQSALSTWMYRVALNVSIYHLKKSKRKVATMAIEEAAGIFNIKEADTIEREEQWRIIRQHIDGLNLLDKGIVLLYLENKSNGEIAQIVGISVSNVGTKLFRIREKLRNQISKNL